MSVHVLVIFQESGYGGPGGGCGSGGSYGASSGGDSGYWYSSLHYNIISLLSRDRWRPRFPRCRLLQLCGFCSAIYSCVFSSFSPTAFHWLSIPDPAQWLLFSLRLFSPRLLNFVYCSSVAFVPGREGLAKIRSCSPSDAWRSEI